MVGRMVQLSSLDWRPIYAATFQVKGEWRQTMTLFNVNSLALALSARARWRIPQNSAAYQARPYIFNRPPVTLYQKSSQRLRPCISADCCIINVVLQRSNSSTSKIGPPYGQTRPGLPFSQGIESTHRPCGVLGYLNLYSAVGAPRTRNREDMGIVQAETLTCDSPIQPERGTAQDVQIAPAINYSEMTKLFRNCSACWHFTIYDLDPKDRPHFCGCNTALIREAVLAQILH